MRRSERSWRNALRCFAVRAAQTSGNRVTSRRRFGRSRIDDPSCLLRLFRLYSEPGHRGVKLSGMSTESNSIRSDPLYRVFCPLTGLPARLVRRGHGSFLTLEFGAPHLRIREPEVASPDMDEQVAALLRRRKVTPPGRVASL